MNNSLENLTNTLQQDNWYQKKFKQVFNAKPSRQTISNAIATFIRTIVSGNSPYDRFIAGEKSALDKTQQEGMTLFFNKFKCNSCHGGYNFSSEEIQPRCFLTQSPKNDKYVAKYKVPTLRNLSFSKPYFHNGRLETISEVLDFYTNSELIISVNEKRALEAYLRSLNGNIYYYFPLP